MFKIGDRIIVKELYASGVIKKKSKLLGNFIKFDDIYTDLYTDCNYFDHEIELDKENEAKNNV